MANVPDQAQNVDHVGLSRILLQSLAHEKASPAPIPLPYASDAGLELRQVKINSTSIFCPGIVDRQIVNLLLELQR